MSAGAASGEEEGPVRARPPRRATAASQIAEALRDEIASLRLLPGTPLVERELTARFGVSRTPLREALIRLAEEGLVEIRPQAGTAVSRIPLAAIPEAVIIRQALEGATVKRAAARSPSGDLGPLRAAMRRLESCAASDDREGFHEADESYHEALAVLAGHPGIWRVVKGAKVQIDRCRRLTLPALGRMEQVIGEHAAILRAVERGDGKAARAAMKAHLGAVEPDARLLARAHPEYFI